ncbi:type III-A CRISPR-associated RAMP protein Csm5 [Desulfobacca acetoxidans]|uniref:CRISPR system Cms protein Csm5 n=1 Tax=Desulfobacca acetoxidans (strain ATCC 700848 / DSM 11109 / ASRB2) TaxID=880072 RepID=F2NCZ1_DESAR|nr:type III-A CRISPR-associated RAMP protein Csm5 [Desulfobacca acetoxidans]AEB09565.1 CRISPR-associated RAMP protein, Csm5 family [Desulfobacca acetoxidans DSM 11109]
MSDQNTTAMINILTPVHIGTGEKYSGLDYLIDEKLNQLFRLPTEGVINALGRNWTIYTEWLDQKFKEIESKIVGLDFKKKSKIERTELAKINLEIFCQTKGIDKDIFFSRSLYKLPCSKNLGTDKDISEFPKQAHLAYMPGSEIKGAIRTALLYSLLKHDSNIAIYEWLKTTIRNLPNIKIKIKKVEKKCQNIIKSEGNNSSPNKKEKGILVKELGKIEDELQKRLLRTKLFGGSDQAHFDILKFLQVGDGIPFTPADFLCICPVEPINTSKKFVNWQEFLVPGKSIPLSKIELNSHKSRIQDYLDKHHFSKLQQSYLSEGRLTQILQACYEFNKALLEEEIAFYGKPHIQKQTPKVIDRLKNLQETNTPTSPLLRLGMGQGYLSVTINLLFKQKEFELYDKVLIHATQNVSYDSEHGGPLPKTRRLVEYNGEIWPPGWIQLQMVEKKTDIFALPKSWSPLSFGDLSEAPVAKGVNTAEKEPEQSGELAPAKPELRPEYVILLNQAQRVDCVPQEFGGIMQKWQGLTECGEKRALAQVLLKKLEPLKLKKRDKLFDYKTLLQQFISEESKS